MTPPLEALALPASDPAGAPERAFANRDLILDAFTDLALIAVQGLQEVQHPLDVHVCIELGFTDRPADIHLRCVVAEDVVASSFNQGSRFRTSYIQSVKSDSLRYIPFESCRKVVHDMYGMSPGSQCVSNFHAGDRAEQLAFRAGVGMNHHFEILERLGALPGLRQFFGSRLFQLGATRLDFLDVLGRCERRLALRQQVITAVTRLDLDEVADATQLPVSVLIPLTVLEDHFLLVLGAGPLGDQDHRIIARVLITIIAEQFHKMLDFKRIFGDHTAICRSGHRWQHRRKAGISAKDFHHQEPLMGTGRCTQVNVHGEEGAGNKYRPFFLWIE